MGYLILKTQWTVSVFCLMALSSTSVLAEFEQSKVSPPAAEVTEESEVLLAEMDLRRWPADGFYESVMSRLHEMTEAHAAEKGAVMLDLAELYLSQMLTVEADSFVEAASETNWLTSARFAALRDAVDLLRGRPLLDVEASPLTVEDRHDHALWRSLNRLAQTDAEIHFDELRGALIGLRYQSGTVARALLPLIAETVVGTGNLELSETALSLMGGVPDLANAPLSHYLHGRHQESLGNEKSALEAYFMGTKGWDRYAALSRIAVADLALEDGSAGALLAARDVLSAGAGSWRGDKVEIDVLERQARVSDLIGDPVDALMAYRRIITRFPDSTEAEQAIDEVDRHLVEVYQKGAKGDLTFSEWFRLHQLLLPTYRYFPSFPEVNEMLADSIFDMGGMHLAISEYNQVLGVYEAWPNALGRIADPTDIDRVTLKLAKAQYKSGMWSESAETLDKIESNDREIRVEIDALRVKIFSEMGELNRLLESTPLRPDEDTLRNRGQALFTARNWPGAKDHFERLWESYSNEFRIADASYLLIAAYRAEDHELARTVARAFPNLTESDGIAGLAAALLEEPEPLIPLNNGIAQRRLERADNTMILIERSGL